MTVTVSPFGGRRAGIMRGVAGLGMKLCFGVDFAGDAGDREASEKAVAQADSRPFSQARREYSHMAE